MPATPFHYPIPFLLSKTTKRLSLPGLIVGSMIPDIEIPIMWVFFPSLQDHFFLHSLIGALTLGTLLACAVSRFLYPPVVSFVFRINRQGLKKVCRISLSMVVSCLVGVMSHLLLDYPIHSYNPILWPWVNPTDIVGPLILIFTPSYDLWTSLLIARAIMHVILLALWCTIVVHLYFKGDLWHRHWVEDTRPDGLFHSNRPVSPKSSGY